MFRNISLKTALAVSLSMHLVILTPWSYLNFDNAEQDNAQIEVTYILNELEKEELDEIVENLPRKYDLEKKELAESPGKEPPAPSEKPQEAPVKEDQYVEEERARELEGYIAYYELIREKIKKRVAKHYKRPNRRGRVDVLFKLDKTGALKELRIAGGEIAEGDTLARIALKSVRAAAPFPPFPDALKKDELTFSVFVIFKKD